MRNPGQRVPVGGISGGECPSHTSPCEAGHYMRVVHDVLSIVEGYEPVVTHRSVHRQSNSRQPNTDQRDARFVHAASMKRRIWHRLLAELDDGGVLTEGGNQSESAHGPLV